MNKRLTRRVDIILEDFGNYNFHVGLYYVGLPPRSCKNCTSLMHGEDGGCKDVEGQQIRSILTEVGAREESRAKSLKQNEAKKRQKWWSPQMSLLA